MTELTNPGRCSRLGGVGGGGGCARVGGDGRGGGRVAADTCLCRHVGVGAQLIRFLLGEEPALLGV